MNAYEAKSILGHFVEHLKGFSEDQWKMMRATPADNDQKQLHLRGWFVETAAQRLSNPWDTQAKYGPNGRFGVANPMIRLTTGWVNIQLEKRDKYRQEPKLHDINEPWNDAMKSKEPTLKVTIPDNCLLFDVERGGDGRWLSRALRLSSKYQGDIHKLVDAIHCEDESIYTETQRLAKLIYDNGFDGILYKAVRQIPGGVWQATNLALFRKPVRWVLLPDLNVIGVDKSAVGRDIIVDDIQYSPNF